jgi:exopolysaccharide production protein ExoQ
MADVTNAGAAAVVPRRTIALPTLSIDWIEKALVVAAFIIFFGTFKDFLADGGDTRTGGSAPFQLLMGGIYLTSMGIVIARGFPGWGFAVVRRAWPLVLLLLLTLVSATWSQDPTVTIRRSIALLLCMWFAFYVVLRFDVRTFINLLVVAFATLLAVTILSVGAGHGTTSGGAYTGAWTGLTGNKNELGRTVAIGVALLPIASVLSLTDRPRTALIVGLIAVPVLLLSKSATSLMAALGGVGLGTFVYVLLGGRLFRYRLGAELAVPIAVISVVSALLLFTVLWTPLLTALGRDPTLTGRTKLWDWALTVNQDRRLLGSGYRSFWINENTRYFFLTFAWRKDANGDRSQSFTGPTHAHSGYVDTMLELGYVGFGAFIVTVLSGLVNLGRIIRRGSLDLGFIFAVILVFLLVYSVTARAILQQAEDLWVLFATFYLFAIKESLFLERKF